jgi:hypothetical protein
MGWAGRVYGREWYKNGFVFPLFIISVVFLSSSSSIHHRQFPFLPLKKMSTNLEQSLQDLRNLVESNHQAFLRERQTSRDYRLMFVHVGTRLERMESHLDRAHRDFRAIHPQIFTREQRRIRLRQHQHVRAGAETTQATIETPINAPTAEPPSEGPFPRTPSLAVNEQPSAGISSSLIMKLGLYKKMEEKIRNGGKSRET